MGPLLEYETPSNPSVKGKFNQTSRRMKVEIDASMTWWELNIGELDQLPPDCMISFEIRRLYKRAQEVAQHKDEVEL